MQSRARVLTLGLALPALALCLASCSEKTNPPGPASEANLSGIGATAEATARTGFTTTTSAPGSSSTSTSPSTPSSSAPSSTSLPPTHGGAAITIRNFSFTPATLTVSPGATVTVHNDDTVTHTVTDGGVFDSGYISGHSTKTFTAPTAPGTYPYICTIHPYMHGTLIVR